MTGIDWIYFILMGFLAIILFSQAYINLIEKRFTHFGIDALMVNINLKLAGKKRRKYVKSHMDDPDRIKKMGINTLLLAIGCIWGIIYYVFFVLPPQSR
jgi:hypothetical protein